MLYRLWELKPYFQIYLYFTFLAPLVQKFYYMLILLLQSNLKINRESWDNCLQMITIIYHRMIKFWDCIKMYNT
jgi:hypothetical protein